MQKPLLSFIKLQKNQADSRESEDMVNILQKYLKLAVYLFMYLLIDRILYGHVIMFFYRNSDDFQNLSFLARKRVNLDNSFKYLITVANCSELL